LRGYKQFTGDEPGPPPGGSEGVEFVPRAGGTLPAEPTASWWAQRWLWLLAPSAVLAVLVALFARVELAARRPRRRAAR